MICGGCKLEDQKKLLRETSPWGRRLVASKQVDGTPLWHCPKSPWHHSWIYVLDLVRSREQALPGLPVVPPRMRQGPMLAATEVR